MATHPPGRESLRSIIHMAGILVGKADEELDAYAAELAEVDALIGDVVEELT